MRVNPVTLEGETVRLEPLSLDHVDELLRVADMDYFQYFVTQGPVSLTRSDFEDYIRGKTSSPGVLGFLIRLKASGEAIGTTSYMDIREPHRGLEIGMTWIAREYQGTRVNSEMKYLLLRHAFEALGCVRVQLKTDKRNLHSQAAIRKLGAQYEGTLRKHGIQRNGYVRDTVMFSITDDEWPEVKRSLENRLEKLE